MTGEVIGNRAGVYFYGDTRADDPCTTLHTYLNTILGKTTGIVFGMCKYDIYVLFQSNIYDRACVFKINKFASTGIQVKYYNNGGDNFAGSWHTLSQSNTTITHYAPVEESITNYRIGKPVFLSGNVYKQQGNEWISSSANDTTDCICSVKASGTYKEFVGIVTEIDVENNCLTFATHGDFLFNVDDTAQYQVGDVICYDGTVLKDDDAITLKVQQSIIGKVSTKINENTLAIFKS